MRKWIVAVAVLTTSCGQSSQDAPVREAESGGVARAGPDIGATLAPGTALTYHYGFLLPAEHLAEVQEQHAGQCEALGAARCRVVGMTYAVVPGRRIDAALRLKLAPQIARRFGKESIATVIARGGMLTNADIESQEVAMTVAAANRVTTESANEQQDIARQLERPGLPAAERTQLRARAAELQNQRNAARAETDAAQLLLASTPMTLDYASGSVDPSLNDGPILGAIKDGWADIVAGSAILLRLAISLLPWLAALTILLWLWRRFGERLGLRAPHDRT